MQSSFFDIENRYTSLSQAGDPLERLDAVSRLRDIQYDPATHRQQTAQKRGVALATDKRDSGVAIASPSGQTYSLCQRIKLF
ncbi:hypothetical protein, partial [Polaromonas sp. UBA4122]|uniref:hypothetical protein n=1 Tax=Polaromonas sp. UBA4122 TaxID=1947074 RepID=UPI0025EC45A3